MDGPGEYYPKWNKPVRERQVPYNFTCMWNLVNKINWQTIYKKYIKEEEVYGDKIISSALNMLSLTFYKHLNVLIVGEKCKSGTLGLDWAQAVEASRVLSAPSVRNLVNHWVPSRSVRMCFYIALLDTSKQFVCLRFYVALIYLQTLEEIKEIEKC